MGSNPEFRRYHGIFRRKSSPHGKSNRLFYRDFRLIDIDRKRLQQRPEVRALHTSPVTDPAHRGSSPSSVTS
jgi:hypothetical protein